MKAFKTGFTLIEVLAALAVLAGLMAVATFSWSDNFRRLRKSQKLTAVSSLLEQKMAELEAQYKNENITNLPLEGEEGEFLENPDYGWKYQTQPLTLPDTLTFLAIQGLPQNDMNISLTESLKDILSKSVVEVQLTVYVKKTGKGHSLSAYFIHYENVPLMVQSILSNFVLPTGKSP